jgi:organic hydroperoxide reductase OsmC/OhrA
MDIQHRYKLTAVWTGNKGSGTSDVAAYERSHTIAFENKPVLDLTTDNRKFGDKTKLNPEDLLVASLSSCHMLSYLYLCAIEGIIITSYEDHTTGLMIEKTQGGGRFKEVILNPVMKVTESVMIEKAIALHHHAHEICYIASSVNFEVKVNPVCTVEK